MLHRGSALDSNRVIAQAIDNARHQQFNAPVLFSFLIANQVNRLTLENCTMALAVQGLLHFHPA